MSQRPLRVVLAKVGLDGHDRGVKVIARGLRDAGFHVIYSGLWQTVEAVVRTVVDEDADLLGISLLNGTHLSVTPRLMEALARVGVQDLPVFIGGIVPDKDVQELLAMGVQRVFGPGATIQEIADCLRQAAEKHRERRERPTP